MDFPVFNNLIPPTLLHVSSGFPWDQKYISVSVKNHYIVPLFVPLVKTVTKKSFNIEDFELIDVTLQFIEFLEVLIPPVTFKVILIRQLQV